MVNDATTRGSDPTRALDHATENLVAAQRRLERLREAARLAREARERRVREGAPAR